MSAAIGASAAGARTYTATASQGLLYMAEALYNASGLGLPIVMTVANRAIGAPINIWNDHSDSMSQRDCGWVQLYAEDNQTAVGAARAGLPAGRAAVGAGDGVRRRLRPHARVRADRGADPGRRRPLPPGYQPRQVLDPDEPVTIGAMVGPEAFTEVRYLAHHQLRQAIPAAERLSRELFDAVGMQPALVTADGLDGARLVVVCLGSVTGTVLDAVDDLAAAGPGGPHVGVLRLGMYRPFPAAQVRAALADADHVIVLERAFAPGAGGVVTADIRTALAGRDCRISTVVAGLGGRAVTKSLHCRF